MKKILVISNNDSIVRLFAETSSALQEIKQGEKIEIINENPPKSFKTVKEAVEKIKSTEFDVLVIGHKLKEIDFKRVFLGLEKPEDGEGLEVLKVANFVLKNKIVISDGITPLNFPQVMSSYRKIGVRHFINRGVTFTGRFNNLNLCLENKCNCDSL